MPTGECSKSGGKSEAGHCPGNEDIQCCTYPANQPDDGDQKSSDDDDKDSNDDDDEHSSDDDDKNKSNDDDDDDDEKSSDDDDDESSDDDAKSNNDVTCKIGDGTPGTCISTTDCSGSGVTSTPGYCPGPNNIQCCTP